jgi:HSP20 family protein
MFDKKELTPARGAADPFARLRNMTRELERAFDDPFWPSFRWPELRAVARRDAVMWLPKVDVFEKDNRLFMRVDLPGVKKEDVKVEVTDGHLTLSGARKHEMEDKKDNVYRTEREYGSFYRAIPLPAGVKLDDVKATFADGLLEVSVPLPARPDAKVRQVEIQEPAKTAKTAA